VAEDMILLESLKLNCSAVLLMMLREEDSEPGHKRNIIEDHDLAGYN
jgi:hypothetical protein